MLVKNIFKIVLSVIIVIRSTWNEGSNFMNHNVQKAIVRSSLFVEIVSLIIRSKMLPCFRALSQDQNYMNYPTFFYSVWYQSEKLDFFGILGNARATKPDFVAGYGPDVQKWNSSKSLAASKINNFILGFHSKLQKS